MRIVSVCIALAAIGCPLMAGTIAEIGDAGATLGTAQSIAILQFSLPQPADSFDFGPTVTVTGNGDGSDVDFFRLDFSTKVDFIIDVDDPTTFDTYLALLDDAGRIVAYNDDSGGDPGSSSDLHSFIGVVNLLPGTYYVAVSQALNQPFDPFNYTLTALFRPDNQEGGSLVEQGPTTSYAAVDPDDFSVGSYTMYMSYRDSQTPEPGTFFLTGAGLVAAGAYLRHRRK
ncbi:MAG: PPC domain-containing protein [Bryobacterales bacterium]|nr:PPC domain-containing protein [Bryobacterales bacterium]